MRMCMCTCVCVYNYTYSPILAQQFADMETSVCTQHSYLYIYTTCHLHTHTRSHTHKEIPTHTHTRTQKTHTHSQNTHTRTHTQTPIRLAYFKAGKSQFRMWLRRGKYGTWVSYLRLYARACACVRVYMCVQECAVGCIDVCISVSEWVCASAWVCVWKRSCV